MTADKLFMCTREVDQMKKCDYCGKLFEPRCNRQKYCLNEHKRPCSVCGKEYVVRRNSELNNPALTCSPQCSRIKMRATSMARYGVTAAGNNEEARKKARETSLKHYGVEVPAQSKIVYDRIKSTMLEKYGVDNIQKRSDFNESALITRKQNWINKVQQEFPLKLLHSNNNIDLKTIDEDDMAVYVIKEKDSVKFLNEFGHAILPKRRKIHSSLGLIKDGLIYQVIRFERKRSDIILADFGTRSGFYNSNQYTKLLDAAVQTLGVDDFTCRIPRSLASLELTYSLSVELVEKGMYEVFWITENNKLKRLTRWDSIADLKQKYDYVTSDYLDLYRYKRQPERHLSVLQELQALK